MDKTLQENSIRLGTDGRETIPSGMLSSPPTPQIVRRIVTVERSPAPVPWGGVMAHGQSRCLCGSSVA
jgi:hypothetical protein